MSNPSSSISASTENTGFIDFCEQYRGLVETNIDRHLSNSTSEATLLEAMRYGVLGGGKRVRALLAYAAAEAACAPTTMTDAAAIALECIHGYSLIHDDLPAMDDDDLRRGKPSCHIAYGEATAILAGDALQTSAFDILATPNPDITAQTQLEMINLLAKASGEQGMVAGQSIDLNAMNQDLTLDQLITMHRLKTGALIRASVALGALSTNLDDKNLLSALVDYAEAIGLAFQIQDDILDVTGDTSTLGKAQGADAALNKPTFVSLLGLDQAQQKTQELYNQALAALSPFGPKALRLRQLAHYIIQRHN